MDDPLLVGGGEAEGDLHGVRRRPAGGHRTREASRSVSPSSSSDTA